MILCPFTLLTLLFTLFTASLAAGDRFVRPFVAGGYGNVGDGSSYAEAWNDISDIDWGEIDPGDTVFICGIHKRGAAYGDAWIVPSVSGSAISPITISGNCKDTDGNPDDGEVYAVNKLLDPTSWVQSQEDSAIYIQNYPGSTGAFSLEGLEEGSEVELMRIWEDPENPGQPLTPWAQWPDGSVFHLGGGTPIYYKPSNGVMVGSRSFHASTSDLIVVIDQNYIDIRDLKLHAANQRVVLLKNADYIRIIDNDMRRGNIFISKDSDYGVLQGNEIHDTPQEAILLYPAPLSGTNQTIDNQSNDDWLIADNHIYNVAQDCKWCKPYRNKSLDRHAIGIQSGNRLVIENNHIHNVGGSGITFYNWSNRRNIQRDNIVRYNLVHDIEDISDCSRESPLLPGEVPCSNEHGIELGSDSQPIFPDTNTGNVVHHNVIYNVKRNALRFKSTKHDTTFTWRISNNVVYRCGTCLDVRFIGPNTDGISFGGEFVNNVFVKPTDRFISVTLNANFGGQDVSGYVIDHNNYFADGPFFQTTELAANPDLVTDMNFMVWRQNYPDFDVNSLTSDPKLVDELNNDFHLLPDSQAIDAGFYVELMTDYDGNTLDGIPDIGAFEFQCADDPEWMYIFSSNGQLKPCAWVAKNTKHRCNELGIDGRLASEACPEACGACVN